MRHTKTFVLVFALVCAAAAQTPTGKVIAEALKPSPLEQNLEELTDHIGGRVPGTPAMQSAVQWGINAFKAAGADTVNTEEFTIQSSWQEGETQMRVHMTQLVGLDPMSSIVPRNEFMVRAVSMAWAPALSAQRNLRIVDVGSGSAEEFARAGNLAGAIALVHSEEMHKWEDLFNEYLRANDLVDRAVEAKAIALAIQSTRPHDLLYRHTNAGNGEIDRIPQVLIAREDASRIARLLAAGQKLQVDLWVPNRIGGPIKTANVVAELRGSEKPDEFVVLGAHLDSWELGTGALDNGCNAALVIDALRAIKASGARPKRTIRFILFSGEEEGLIGSHVYAQNHRAELDKAAGVVIFDAGIGKVTGFSLGGRKDIVDAVTKLAEPLRQFDAATMTTDASYGTDHFDFLLEGVPTLVANQEEDNYLINYHAESDTFDKVDIARLKKHVAVAAGMTFAIADAPDRIGPRPTRAQIAPTLQETGLDVQMKGFRVWDDWAKGVRGRQK
jgi:Zn-dependent M28 family amino/carboxypeptidase